MRRALLLAAIAFLALGCFAWFSPPTPEGYDPEVHGSGGICSSAVLEVIGLGSKDTNSASGGGGPSIGIDDCKDPARTQTILGLASFATAIAVLIFRSRIPIAPALTIDGQPLV